jgi:putative transposase
VVSPARKRDAVTHLQQTLEVPERRACLVIHQPRSTQRYQAKRPLRDACLVKRLHELSRKHPRYGYRRITATLKREGIQINEKRVARLWRQEGLRVPTRVHKRRRLGESSNSSQRRCSTRMNEVWCYDFIYDQTEDGRRLKWLPLCDEFTRENIALEVARRMEAKDVIRVLEAAVAQRGAPKFIRSDNGPEFIAKAVRDWIASNGFGTLFIEPGSPWQNPYSETFNSKFRDELLNMESFGSVLEAKVLGKEYRRIYNEERVHSALDYRTPSEYARHCQLSDFAPLHPSTDRMKMTPELKP